MTDDRDRRNLEGADSPTEYIPRDNTGGTSSEPGDDAPTQFLGHQDIGSGETPATAWSETRQVPQPGSNEPSGQYWSPLTPEEQQYADADYAGGSNDSGPYPGGSARAPRPGPIQGGQGRVLRDPEEPSSSVWPMVIGGVVLLIVVVAALAVNLGHNDTQETIPTTPTPTTTAPPETPAPGTTEPNTSIDEHLDSLRDEIESMRENPPSIPGIPGGEASEQVIPEAIGKSPAEVELNLRRLGFNDITVVDANGDQVNSLTAVTGTVAAIEPPSGSTASTGQPVTMYLE